MMRSLYSGISGLRNHQTRMDVIGNNIANVNTTGFKSSRVIFQEIFSQTLGTGMANDGDTGGTNPMQIGLGMRMSTVDVLHTRGIFQSTGNPTDMMIDGDGFFVVEGTEGTFFTRAGNFNIDNDGYLVTSNGEFVMGALGFTYTATWAPERVEVAGVPQPPEIEDPANPSTNIPNPNYQPPNIPNPDVGQPGHVPGTAVGADIPNPAYPAWITPPVMRAAQWDLTATPNTPAQDLQRINVNPTIVGVVPPEANPQVPSFVGISVNPRGEMEGFFGDERHIIAQIHVAMFSNPGGLERVGNSLYVNTGSSGEPQIEFAFINGAGQISSSGLEMSNVDLSNEFTDMIVTQRGFQANSRIITVSDTMLEELVNLKR